MNKEQIIIQLQKSYKDFTDYIMSLHEDNFMFTINDKWTAGQQAEHISSFYKTCKDCIYIA
jgi:hypothetical protein